MALKRKAMASAAALALVALIATGTFAWTSLNSQKINEWFGTGTKPGTTAGGTLHDDHDNDSPADPNKQVYIENWGDKPLFVRIRLDEYMEVGEGAGKKTYEPNEIVKAYSFIPGAKLNDPKTWKTHIPKASEPNMCGFDDTAGQGDFHEYWEWQMGGQKYYYPAPEGSREDKDFVAQGSPADLTADSANVKQTLAATVLTMEQWKAGGSQLANSWVIDTDGWAYWAAPLGPGQATGLLLNKVERTATVLQTDYYYGINVVAQMATKDDDGLDNYERFGDEEHGGWTTDGQALMRLIVGIEYIYVHTQYWVPNTKEEMFDDAENIIIAKVINTEIKTGPDYVDEISGIKHVYTISTVLVEETLKGNFSANEEIMVIQPGDGKTIIVDRIDDIDGYLTDGSRWLLLLNKDDDIHKEWYLQNLNSDIMHMPMAGVGQYRLDGMDNIMVMSDISRHLLGSVDTVAEFKAMIEDYYTYPSD